MKTFTSEQKASDFMRMKNRTAVKPSRSLNVLVDGPDDLEFTVMPLTDHRHALFCEEEAAQLTKGDPA